MLTKSEEQFLKAHEPQLRKPVWKFVLIYGLAWALVVGVLTSVIGALLDPERAFWKRAGSILSTVLIWICGGIVYGLWFRFVIARRCHKIRKKQSAVGEPPGSQYL